MSNIDLVQYNGTAAFPSTADVGTAADQWLEPTDGPYITAQSNGGGEAPVAPVMNRAKDLLLGLRDAIIGDRPAAQRKTLKSLEVDGTGAGNSALGAGEVSALGNITSQVGDFLATLGGISVKTDINTSTGSFVAPIGDLVLTAGNALLSAAGAVVRVGGAAAQRVLHQSTRIAYLGVQTGAGDQNPPQGTAIANELRAINVPKASARITMDAANTITSFPGFGVTSITIVATSADVQAVYATTTHGLKITLASNMSNLEYRVTATNIARKVGAVPLNSSLWDEDYIQRTVNSFVLFTKDQGPPTTTPLNVQFDVFGQQTT